MTSEKLGGTRAWRQSKAFGPLEGGMRSPQETSQRWGHRARAWGAQGREWVG